jgi:hypothetical protein
VSWFKIDDGFWSHPKILGLSSDAIALWVRAGAWASGQLTDGAVPGYAIAMFQASPETVHELVECDLWTVTSAGYQFHDWAQYQRSRAEVMAERNANKERQKRHRDEQKRRRAEEAAGGTAGTTNGGSDAVDHGESNGVTDGDDNARRYTPPDPTRPDQVSTDVDTSPEASKLASETTMLCNLLADLIAANGSKRPTIGKAWHTAARLMLTADGRDVDKAANLIRWSQQHRFWQSKVMSMPTFRADYDKMRLQANTEATQRGGRGQMPAERAQETVALAAVVAANRGEQGQREVTA